MNRFITSSKGFRFVLGTILALFLLFCIGIFFKENMFNMRSERERNLDTSLKHLMIRYCGIYTLVGSKPITTYEFNFPDVDEGNLFDQSSMLFRHKQQLEFWFQVWKEYTGKRYLFFEEEAKGHHVFINVAETAYVMHKYYPKFREALGYEFEPIDLISQFPHAPSVWAKIKSNHFLMGILCGFGERSSYLFELRSQGKIPSNDTLFINPKEMNKGGKSFESGLLSMKDLPLPSYILFSSMDEMLSGFERERTKIQEIYKGKDFLETTLLYLKSEDYIPPFIVTQEEET